MARSYSTGRKDANEAELIKLMNAFGIAVYEGEHETAGFDRKAVFRKKSYFVEIKNPKKFNKSYIENGKRVPLTIKEAAERNLTENEKKLKKWCLIHGIPYVVIYDLSSIKSGFNIE